MRQLLRKIRRRLLPAPVRPLILMYHRIASPKVDPWGLAVRPANFEAHLGILRRRRSPMTVSELVRQLDRGALPDDAVAVTFDDGYVDNLRRAKPLLSAAGVPGTLFVTTGAIGQQAEFWWDEVARGILAREAALDCTVTIAGEPIRIAFDAIDPTSIATSGWRAWQDPATPREAAYMHVWSRLRAAPARERDAAMRMLRQALGQTTAHPDDLPMSASGVAEMAAEGLVEIGGHTVTHPVLPLLDPDERRREILDGKQACERMVHGTIAGFAYPHGAIDDDSRAAVQECGFAWACSTVSACVSRTHPDRFALPRMFVEDWDGPAFERALATAGAHAVAAEATASGRGRSSRLQVTS